MHQLSPCFVSRNLTRASVGFRYARCGYVDDGPEVAMTGWSRSEQDHDEERDRLRAGGGERRGGESEWEFHGLLSVT